MTWNLSTFGEKLSAHSGINELMRDLGEATSGRNDLLMLGGGNPAHVPDVELVWRKRWNEISATPDHLERALGNYDGPQGNMDFIEALVDSLRRRYGWEIRRENVAVVNGSQNAFFYLFNMLAGHFERSPTSRKVLLPLAPEYIGYADQGIQGHMFNTVAPKVELIGDHQFKYHIDFEKLTVGSDISAICVSRPTNPSGNVLTNEEVGHLEALAAKHHIPLLIDNAYGAPFPDIIFNDIQPLWTDHTILVMSLSKLGLPGTRTGIILAREDIESISAMNAVAGLANGNIGQVIATPLLRDGSLYDLSRSVIRPYYEKKSRQAVAWLMQALDPTLPYRIHVSEGALFLWIWFDHMPITSEELYRRLKRRNVLIIPGHYFFYGMEEEHDHHHRCIRLSYAMGEATVQKGITIIAEEVKRAYAEGTK